MVFIDPVLLEALETGDLELRFPDGRSIKVHSAKLKLASMQGGILRDLIEDLVEDQIMTRKRRTDEGEINTSDLPFIKVRTEE